MVFILTLALFFFFFRAVQHQLTVFEEARGKQNEATGNPSIRCSLLTPFFIRMKLLIGSLALFALVASVAAGGGLGPVPPTFGLRRGGGHGRKGAPEPVPVPVMWAPTYWPTAPPPAVSTGRKSVSVEAPPIMNAAIDLGDQYLPKQHFQSSNAPRLGHIKEVEIIQRVCFPPPSWWRMIDGCCC